jgi:competence protein ComGC
MSGDIQVVKRKKDLVTGFAVFLFLILLIFELVLVFYIPTQYKRSNWVESTAKAELIGKIDSLRNGLERVVKHSTSQAEKHELELAQDVLNDYARYLKEYKDNIAFEQINMLQHDILLFDNYFGQWKRKKFLIKQIPLNLNSYKKEQLLKNGCHIPITKTKKGSK